MKRTSRHVCQAIAVASALAMPLASRAESTSDGQSFKALSAQWWQWVLSVPTAANPLTDTSGANCMVGQRGPVWFLAGSLFGGAASRRCSVPEGVPLFFPIVNNVQVNTPNICGQTAAITVAQMRAVIAPFIDGVTGLTVTLNSRAVTGIRRVQSDPFISALPADNIFVAPCGGHPTDSPAGVYSPSADDGYYVKLDGLHPGTHTLQFTAKNDAASFNLNVVYVLDVIAVSKH